MLIDKPLSELYHYQGLNPRPDDFEQYWEDALAEMQDVDSNLELRPAKFTVPFADCFNLFFTGVGGSRIHAKYVRPKGFSRPHPAILQFHGYSANSGDWTDKLSFAALGFSVIAMDCRGQGGYSEDLGRVVGNTLNGHIIRGLDGSPRDLAFRQIFLDAAQLANIVMSFEEVDADRIGAMGGSQGGGVTIASAALVPQIKRIAPVYPFLSDYQRVWEMDLARNAYNEITEYFRRFDPLHERRAEIFARLGYVDIQHLAHRIKAEVLMATGMMDVICPPSTQFACYNKIKSPKQIKIYPDFGHEYLPEFSDLAFEFMSRL